MKPKSLFLFLSIGMILFLPLLHLSAFGKNIYDEMQPGQEFQREKKSYAIPISESTIPHYGENRAGSDSMGFPEYIVGPTDELTITLWLKTKGDVSKIMVRPDGRISFLFVQDLVVAGLTPTQVDVELTNKLRGYVKKPNLDVLVTKFNSKKVSLFGEIERLNTGVSGPGIYPLRGKTPILNLLLDAGGYTEKADLRNVELTRMGKVYKIDLARTLFQGDQSQNIILEGGDSIVISELQQYKDEKILPRKVFVLGDVAKAGVQSFKKDIRVIEAISLAGGILKEADEANARILRGNKEIPVNIKKMLGESRTDLNIQIEDGDIIYIPKLMEFEDERLFSKRVYISGGVNKEGLYKFKKKIGIMEAITIAGGFHREAYRNDTYIIRGGQKLPINIDTYLASLDPSKNIEVKDGDIVFVPKQDRMIVSVYGEVIRQGQFEIKGRNIFVADAIARASGYTQDAVLSDIIVLRGDIRNPEILRADFKKYFKKRDLSQNFLLKEGDVVYIPRSKLASASYVMQKIAPLLSNLMYPGLYRDMYTTGGGMRFDTGFPQQVPSAVEFPNIVP